MRRNRWSPTSRGALGLALASAALAGLQARRLLGSPEVPVVPPAVVAPGVVSVAAAGSLEPSAIQAAIEAGPFHPERRAPSVAFRLPGEEDPNALASGPVRPGTVRLVGTAVIGAGGFAVAALGADSPRLVRLGDSLGDYTLRNIGRGSAVFVSSAGERVEVSIPKAGS